MSKTKYRIVIISLAFLGCSSPRKEELIIINKLNDKYSNYEFATAPGPIGTHLNLYLKDATWDSLSLKRLYDSSIQAYNKSAGIPWVYLTVYESSGNYLFTIVKDKERGHIFFRE
jgi:hypothetical protein